MKQPNKIKNLPKLFENKVFSNFVNTEKNKNIVKICIEYCKNFNQDGPKSLVLSGDVGTGKTHLAIAIAVNIPKIPAPYANLEPREPNIEFIVADEFYMKLNDAQFEHKSKLQIIEKWLENDLFILDDLGMYNVTPAKIENLYTFINKAYLSQRRIIITTNFTVKQLDLFDKRIGSRLAEMAAIITINGLDYRKTAN